MKPTKLRRQLAREAARLICERSDLRFSDALRTAIERLCPGGMRPYQMPTDEEIGEQLKALASANSINHWGNRFTHYENLLRPLAEVVLPRQRHPEGDALYHSLQVFWLVRDQAAYDEELLTAALLHEVGQAIDRRKPIAATLTALVNWITPRTTWFIEQLPAAIAKADGTLGARAWRRLQSGENCEELVLLADCDLAGRERGVAVDDLESAVGYLRALSEADEDIGQCE